MHICNNIIRFLDGPPAHTWDRGRAGWGTFPEFGHFCMALAPLGERQPDVGHFECQYDIIPCMLQRDLGDYGNLKNYLTTRLQKMDKNQQVLL